MTDSWWDDPIELKARLEAEGTITKLSHKTGVPRSTLSSARDRHQKEGTWPEPQTKEIDAADLKDVDALLRSRGLDIDEWIIDGVTVNEWGTEENPARQLKVKLRRRVNGSLLQPAVVKPIKLSRSAVRKPARASRLVFVYGDDQRPHVDRTFEALKLEWLRVNQPEVIVDLGDGMDAPTISGHKTNPAMNWDLQECANDYASWLYSVRTTVPDAEIVVLADNHLTQRLRDYQLARAADLYGVSPAKIEGMVDDLEPLLSIRRLLRLDELGVTYLDPPGGTHYAESHYEILPEELVALHGYRTGTNVGRKFLDDYGCSVIYGHKHAQDVTVTDTKRRGIGRRKRLTALGVGCGAIVQGGGGFAPGADWQNSALTVSVFPDGGWTYDQINYEDGVLRWRDQEYRGA